ncbi:MAG TPA: hypothetical protein DD364_00935, partial [Ruminococcaceae bacterium]|nr:hypothetical protein [Oscillospiraceae bacterium]
MKKSTKIIISVLAIILVGAIIFDVAFINNTKLSKSSKENTTVSQTTQSEQTTEPTYSNPVEAQAREMVKNMTLYEKVGQMLLYYIPKQEPLKKMA